jgi:hypothetical protein
MGNNSATALAGQALLFSIVDFSHEIRALAFH